ncbi:alpha/beta hydrolase [Fulvimonas sp. R45]|uniref:alpha/beta fold hydrolase n=1 Tax=Fulvimonas sp. R45 TaxID=3045937 RepID=UPI00265EA2B6|nr:alpha/beta hydrolase [Fulvimonas sp. R45]MDO1528968.1 alpha/beta hydrolase [Fulvimonas sp. R45]
MRKHRGWRYALVVALAGLAGASMAAEAVPAERIGTLQVQRHGDRGRPVILIPGLECGPWVWQRTIADLEKDHVVYAVTLAGFDGVPAPAPDAKAGTLLDRADASLLKLIERRHLDKPVLVGHSIGGTLALRFAGEHADLLSGVVAVDGLPVFPGMERVGAAQRQAMAGQMKARYAAMTPAQFQAAALSYMRIMGVIDPQLAARAAPRLARSDAAATADYMAADLAADYRPGLKQANVPILEISPYNAPDFAAAAAMSKQPVMSEEQKATYYRSLLANAPYAKVVSVSPSRHFVMLDQPAKFRQVLDGFLESP